MERCTVVVATLLFSLSTALRMRSAPHSRLAAAISVIRMMVSGATLGLVEGATARDVRRQKSRKARRCQRSRVAGCTISKACRPTRAADQQDH